MGLSTGRAGKDELAQYIKDRSGSDGAYIGPAGFFSKYKQKRFAYAYVKGGPIYMQYSNSKWGPDQLDRVFAHETGHVFNAPDEYERCNCDNDYGKLKGTCTAKNQNCVGCTNATASPQSRCIIN
jgi:hypothetical protein